MLKTDQRTDWRRNFLCKWNTLLQQICLERNWAVS